MKAKRIKYGLKTAFRILLGSLAIVFLYVLFLTRAINFDDRFAYVLFADDQIINAQVSDDQQWRIKCEGPVPQKLETALLLFEDRHFYKHPGVNPLSLWNAFIINMKAGKVVRGGSTLTMQLARIHEKNRKRTYYQKSKEILLAFAIELKYSKSEILKLYAQYAPFGGNTVGYCAASQRYYGKRADNLSWSEAATLSVLPNAPSDIYPGKGQQSLIKKRNFVLHKLLEKKWIDSTSYRLSILEDLPSQSNHFEPLAPHLLEHFKKKNEQSGNYHSTIDYSLQQNVRRVLKHYSDQYSQNGIDNLSAIVLRNDGEVVAYIGNSLCQKNCANQVDINLSERSPGSVLKPFLYGVSLDAGYITPTSLVEDIPVFFNGYTPRNFDQKFRGVIEADKALTQSLNIPAINLLARYSPTVFREDLVNLGFQTIDKSADHYGLSLILGGCEIRPLDLAQAYMNLSRVSLGQSPTHAVFSKMAEKRQSHVHFPLSQGASFLVLDMLKGVNRPESREGWEFLSNQTQISWKTGTSFGFRDAWSVGTTKDYTLVVWVGNADGEGKAGMTGISKAAPILFDLFDLLPNSHEVSPPIHALNSQNLCAKSGYLAGDHCDKNTLQYVPKNAKSVGKCTYHKRVLLDQTQEYRVFHQCATQPVERTVFHLSPIINNYYKKISGANASLPPLHPNCKGKQETVQILYPPNQAKISLPVDIDDQRQALVCRTIASQKTDSLFWFVNQELVNITHHNHKIALEDLELGNHLLTVVSSDGEQKTHQFEIVK